MSAHNPMPGTFDNLGNVLAAGRLDESSLQAALCPDCAKRYDEETDARNKDHAQAPPSPSDTSA
jgi:uncharacterized protein YlaI